MPIKHAASKALRKTRKNRIRNLSVVNQIKSLIKKTKKAIEVNKKEEVKALVAKTVKALDKAFQHKIMKKNTVARMKSRLMKRLNALK